MHLLTALNSTEQKQQVVDVHRLDEVGVEPGLLRTLPIRILSVSRHRHQGHALQFWLLAASAGHLVAIHDREADVEQDHVGMMLTCQVEGLLAVECRVDLLPQGPEQHLQALGVASLIIDDQDPPPRQLRDAWLIGRGSKWWELASESAATGRRTTNSLPWPSPALWAVTRPPCSSISDRTRVNPIPSPPRDRDRVRSAWVNRSKILGSRSGAMPMPLSRTRMMTSSPILSAVREICPPSSVYFAALFKRLESTWASRAGSTSTRTGSGGSVIVS